MEINAIFQSTRPVRGATCPRLQVQLIQDDFNPRAPCGARLNAGDVVPFFLEISIHAPRAGRDPGCYNPGCYCWHFNPRAPCGARHGCWFESCSFCYISIHAPRAGRDLQSANINARTQISIHAPRAGRDPRTYYPDPESGISIHAPRAGRDNKA